MTPRTSGSSGSSATSRLTFFSQMLRCVEAGHLVSVDSHRELPASYAAREPQTSARFALFAGKLNRCFLPESQERTFEFLNRYRPGTHSLHILPTYGHLDVFMGVRAAEDVFPLMLDELDRT